MSYVSAITSFSYSALSFGLYGQLPLSASTRQRLIALGVDTSGIKTEAEGIRILKNVEMKQTTGATPKKAHRGNQEDELKKAAIELAKKLNISVSDSETVDDIISDIKANIATMKKLAGDDFDKKEDVAYYERKLIDLETTQTSMIDLSASMGLAANMNMAFHGIF